MLSTLRLCLWAEAADFCGVKSRRDTDKFQAMHLTAAPCAKVKAPQVAESPVSIECKVKSIVNYGTHDMFLAEIVAVNVDDTYINDKGRLDLEKAGLVAYAHGHYYTLGRNLGGFGFSVNKERLKKRQKTQKEKNERASVVRTGRTAAAVFRRQTRGFKSAAQTLRQAESCQKSIKKRVSRRPVSATSAFKALTMIAGKPPAKIRNERQSRENFRADIFPTLCRQKTSHIPNPA